MWMFQVLPDILPQSYHNTKTRILALWTIPLTFAEEYFLICHKQIIRHPSIVLYVILRKNDERYIGIVEFPNQIGFTHQVAQGENLVRNDIIKYYSILPTPSQKISAFAFVNAETLRARYMDQRRFLDGKDVSIIPNFILECTNSISPKAAVNAVKNIALQLSEQHGKNSAAIVSRTKAFLAENAETSDSLDTVELSHMVFPESDELAEEFVQQIHQQGIPVSIPVERTYAIREGKKHKIKTDTGIEITIPSDFFDNSEYIEFINNPNGTISISIKNVGKIINR